MSLADAAMTRDVLRDITRRPVDVANLEVHVVHGIVYLQGRVDSIRGEFDGLDLRKELDIIMRMLRLKPGIRDVVCEVDLGNASLRERLSPHPRHD